MTRQRTILSFDFYSFSHTVGLYSMISYRMTWGLTKIWKCASLLGGKIYSHAHKRMYLLTIFSKYSPGNAQILYCFNQRLNMVTPWFLNWEPDAPLLYTYVLLMAHVSLYRKVGHGIVACLMYPCIPMRMLTGPGSKDSWKGQSLWCHSSLQFAQGLRSRG